MKLIWNLERINAHWSPLKKYNAENTKKTSSLSIETLLKHLNSEEMYIYLGVSQNNKSNQRTVLETVSANLLI